MYVLTGIWILSKSDDRFIGYLPSAVASATMLHVLDRLKPCIGEKYQDQLLGILGIVKVIKTLNYMFVHFYMSNMIVFTWSTYLFGTEAYYYYFY